LREKATARSRSLGVYPKPCIVMRTAASMSADGSATPSRSRRHSTGLRAVHEVSRGLHTAELELAQFHDC
jgi:hypothetical protein